MTLEVMHPAITRELVRLLNIQTEDKDRMKQNRKEYYRLRKAITKVDRQIEMLTSEYAPIKRGLLRPPD